ncbi:MAG: alpha/beta hydrolase [Fibrobacteres bacterium]|nr:alpha/beta hydrolase [Fibrobacterota bacterium]
MAIQTHVDIDRLRIEESGTGPAILCLHGVGGCGAWFTGLARRLEDRFRILSLDLPGTGQNRQAFAPFSIERCARVLAEYLEKRETGPVAVLGHSMGAILGLHLAAAVPARMRALISVGGLPSITAGTRARLTERKPLIEKNGMGGLGWKVATANFSKASLARSPETLALFSRLWESQDPSAYLEAMDSLMAAEAESLAAHAKMPCLVLRGKEDGYAPAEESRRFAASLPGTMRFFELEGCAHMPFLEDPQAFAEAIAAFPRT